MLLLFRIGFDPKQSQYSDNPGGETDLRLTFRFSARLLAPWDLTLETSHFFFFDHQDQPRPAATATPPTIASSCVPVITPSAPAAVNPCRSTIAIMGTKVAPMTRRS
jgi:hypothetical protein